MLALKLWRLIDLVSRTLRKIGKSSNILAFLDRRYRTIPIFPFGKPIYEV